MSSTEKHCQSPLAVAAADEEIIHLRVLVCQCYIIWLLLCVLLLLLMLGN